MFRRRRGRSKIRWRGFVKRGSVVALLLIGVVMNLTAEQYIEDVLSGKQVTGRLTRLAVERHVRDLERQEDRDFPFYHDPEAAIRKIEFTQQLRHSKGEWANPRLHDTRICLEPWQQFIDWCLYGWKRKADGYRRFLKAYVEVARKNGKTTDGAAKANYAFFADRPREEGAEVYFGATKRDQAKIAWREAEAQIRKHPYLRKKAKTYSHSSTIIIPGTQNRMLPLGKDSDTEDGLNPHFALIDEYHAHPDNSILEIVESGMAARRQPLIYVITTAGFDKNSVCYQEERTLAVNILERNIDPVPETVFAMIFALDEGDDWADRNVWIKANPNLGVSVRWEFLEKRVEEALAVPSKQNDIITKNFNVWTQAVTRWISPEAWKACNGKVFEAALTGRICYGGLDLSTNIDITAWVMVFPPEQKESEYRIVPPFFIPEENLLERERRDKVPYSAWARDGFVILTPGDVIDYDFIEAQILKDAETFDLQELAYDRWNATEIVNHLSENGVTMAPFGQGYASMNPACQLLEQKILAKEIAHGDNPVLTWMMSCTELKSDPAGNVKPVKPDRRKSGKRIDGIIATLMAMHRAVSGNETTSVYEGRGVRAV